MAKHKTKHRFTVQLKQVARKRVLRYLFVGGTVYVLEMAIIVLATRRGESGTVAVTFAYVIGLVVSFFLQKIVTFGDKRMHHRIVFAQAAVVTVLVLWNWLFTLMVTRFLAGILPATMTRTLALLITTIWNFYLYKTRIFRVSKPKKPAIPLVVHTPKPLIHDVMVVRPNPSVSQDSLSSSAAAEPEKRYRLQTALVITLCMTVLGALVFTATFLTSYSPHSFTKAHMVYRLPPKVSNIKTPDVDCTGRTVMQFVAHQDDDLLFMNPDMTKSLTAGDCVRTVYLTAGNAAAGTEYMKQREDGARAAYAAMVDASQTKWLHRPVQLGSIHIPTDTIYRRVSLLYLRLPDGGLRGAGFGDHKDGTRSLEALYTGHTLNISSIDGKNTYTSDSLTSTLEALIDRYKPIEIRAQAVLPENTHRDHSDHFTSGLFVQRALASYRTKHSEYTPTLTLYQGYANIFLPANVSGPDLDKKIAVFMAYAPFDGSVCHGRAECTDPHNLYNKYLARQYTLPVATTYRP